MTIIRVFICSYIYQRTLCSGSYCLGCFHLDLKDFSTVGCVVARCGGNEFLQLSSACECLNFPLLFDGHFVIEYLVDSFFFPLLLAPYFLFSPRYTAV